MPPMVLMSFAVLLKPGMERKDRRRLTGFLIVSLIIFAGFIGSFYTAYCHGPC